MTSPHCDRTPLPHKAPRAALKTLGCKVNQFDGEQLRTALEAHGYCIVPFEAEADVYVVNSCTVTATSDRDTRRLARQARRRSPGALVVITGCYAQSAASELRTLGIADLVVGNDDRGALVEEIAARAPSGRHGDATVEPWGTWGPLVRGLEGHTRAFVKVQEGCDAHCAYCIVPSVRGPGRSVPEDVIMAQVALLVEAGCPEVVLMGTHLGQYQGDGPDGGGLAELLGEVVRTPGLGRVRLSSIEPMEVTRPLQDLVCDHPLVCRYLHMPLQSGADSVLERMGRPYRAEHFAALVRQVGGRCEGLCVGSDVMVGFPGETDDEFRETVELLDGLPVAYLHVFAYSPRPGTPAAEMPGQVPPQLKAERSRELRALSERKWSAFMGSQVGRELEVVFERVSSRGGGRLEGLADNYARVSVEADEGMVGTIGRVLAESLDDGVLLGRLAGRPVGGE